jgi:DNA-binding SARP family transcriptional activator
VRGRVLEALSARFEVPVTVVVAGAGFGKTTALAQAIRANEASPRGVDAWIACEPGDEDAGRLASAILAALGAAPRRGGNVERIIDALRQVAPVDVCIVIDDVHELPLMSAGEELVRDLAMCLPPHGHLLLAGREPVQIPLARRRAAGQVMEVGPDALAFGDAEVVALAGLLGKDPDACADLAGWPSLVRLVLSAPPGALRQFLWEEIVARLAAPERAGLLALAVLGSGSASEVAAVAGDEVDVEGLVGSVPLLYQDTQGRFGAHQLWEGAVERIFPAAQIAEARRRALRTFVERGETVRMGSAAARWQDADMFGLACVSLVLESLGALPIDTAARWLTSTPAGAVGGPEQRLLEVALRHAQRRDDDEVDAELDQIEATFQERRREGARGVTLALASVVAHTRGDNIQLLRLVERIRALPGAAAQPELRFLVNGMDAALASLLGDVDGALDTIASMSFTRVPPLVAELATRLHLSLLEMAGRADEAVAIASSLLESPFAHVRSLPAMVRWWAGDPCEHLAAPPGIDELFKVNHRDRFVWSAHGVVVAASLGDQALVEVMRRELEATAGPSLDARDSAIVSTSLACSEILAHDDEAARSVIADHLARHPLSNRAGEAHLRRTFAVAYICDEQIRRQWDDLPLGRVHLRARAAARQFLAARQGRLDRNMPLEPPGVVVTSLPLPWSVELAVRAVTAGHRDGADLFRTIAVWLPTPTRREIDWLTLNGDALCRHAAPTLIDDIPDPDQTPLHVDVLGAMRLRLGDRELTGPELGRGRVRTLLALLVLRGALRRERICDLLWPDLEPVAGAQNLRVTLSRLRRLLEPTHPSAPSTQRLRAHGDIIELTPPPVVETDVARVYGYLANGERARRISDSLAEIECLERAVELWRGDPLLDLVSIDELDGEVESVRRSLVDACLRLGELQLVGGRFDEALRCAERSRAASPYSERAVRLAIACHLQRNDHAGLASTVRATRQLLDDLGVEAESATNMLLTRAATRLGTNTD